MATMQRVPESLAVADGAEILTERDVTELTGVSASTLRQLHLAGMGPAYIETSGRRLYRPDDVLKWNAERSASHKLLMASYGVSQ